MTAVMTAVRTAVLVMTLCAASIRAALDKDAFCDVDGMTLTIGMEFYTILDLNEDSEIFSSKQSIFMKWTDKSLVNVSATPERVYITPAELSCYPTIVLEESVDTLKLPPVELPVSVNRTSGEVAMMHQFTYRGVCKVDPTYYPFDKQICAMTLYSEVQSVRLQKQNISTESYFPHSEFELLAATVDFADDEQDSLEGAFFGPARTTHAITFAVVIRRKPLFYIVTLVIPSTLVVIVALIGLFSAAGSSPSRISKAQLGIMAMLSMGIQMLTINKEVPVNSDTIPPLTIYYSILIFLTAFSTSLSVFLVHIHHVKIVTKQKVSVFWYNFICNYIGFIVCKSAPCRRQSPKIATSEFSQDDEDGADESRSQSQSRGVESSSSPGVRSQRTHRATNHVHLSHHPPDDTATEDHKWLQLMETLDRFILLLMLLVVIANAVWFVHYASIEIPVPTTY